MTRYRRGGALDSEPCFRVCEAAIDDPGVGPGHPNDTAGEPWLWDIRRPLFDHLAATADEWWIARTTAARCSDMRDRWSATGRAS